ncbi:inositol polyphosphate 5-phosphatase [Tulasnella sp. 403]|nr:inositol polyphosphate 5-phosphatase [Tulasnella sp. 403]
MHLWLRDYGTRTLLLLTSAEDELKGLPSRALVFRAGRNSQAVVEFLGKDDVDRDGLIRLSNRPIEGCLGLINVEGDIFLVVVTSATVIGDFRPSTKGTEMVSRIHEVGFFCINSSRYDLPYDDVPSTPLSFDAADSVMSKDQQYYNAFTAPAQAQIYEHPCAPLKKIFSSGSFYYTPYPYWDLSTRLSERLKRRREGTSLHDIGTFDSRFVWNEYIILAIQGYVGLFTVPLPAPPSNGAPIIGTIGLISRLGWRRAGTRFNTRGVDDEGNVANFVESETLFRTPDVTFSYIQVRGTSTVFWEQQGLQTFGHRIQITRPQLASQPAFERHFAQLVDEYSSIHIMNLLGQKEGEAALANAYIQHLRANDLGPADSEINITSFDFHNEVRAQGHDRIISTIPRMSGIRTAIDKFGFLTTTGDSIDPITEQRGVFRTNCLDCLDRTNFVQDVLSRTTLEQYLFNINRTWVNSAALWGSHREMWAENGDALSKIYAGTGALNTSFTRTGKRTLAGVLSDATKSVSRAYINNFQDKGKQTAIDLFLTGLRGMSGNKGAVAIRLKYHDTSFCFLTAHLAAGHTNVEERNNDYHTIDDGLRFSKGRTIRDHDVVIWAADTNYRVDLDNATVRSYATNDNLEALIMEDQLIHATHTNAAFMGYQEGPLTFRPTYRYDLFSDNYDTSEKQRIPAWTDRILYRGLNISLNTYSRAELRGSDHRPVYAFFDCEVLIIDTAKKNALQDEIQRGLTSTENNEKLEEKLARVALGAEDNVDLPPPSSAEACWWDGPDHPNGLFPSDIGLLTTSSTNPFDSDVNSTSSSEEELYRLARPLHCDAPFY